MSNQPVPEAQPDTSYDQQTAAAVKKPGNPGTWVGLGLVVAGFALALIPLLGVIGWPLMLAGLVLGIVGAAKKWQPMWANIVNIVLGFAGPGLAIILVTGALATGAAVDEAGRPEAPAASEEAGAAEAEEAGEAAAQGDFAVSIDGSTVGADYEGKPALIVSYTFTNNSDEATSFLLAVSAKAFQDGVQLSPGISLDLNAEDLMKEIKPGASIQVQKAYVLSGESEVTVEVSELIDFSDTVIASKVFAVQ